ncbi:MAG: Phosphopantetheine adenylyltransferase [Actinomycetota bacterium]|jgi:pantetheine-phosphate adenylyltransferase
MRKAVCPGSFDPVTLGHVDVFARAANQFDEVTVAVLINSTKAGFFTIEERIDLIKQSVSAYPNIKVESFQGLLVDYCKKNEIGAIVKGLRAVSDFDYELQMAQMNSQLGIDTLFVATKPEFSFLSSSIIKEIAKYAGDVSALVPAVVDQALKAKFKK